jgi:Cytidylate kinase-like family/Resolvase, N terminal domain
VISVRVCAPMEFRVRAMMERLGRTDSDTVREEIERFDAARARTLRAYFNVEQEDARLYHIVLNTEHLSVESCQRITDQDLDIQVAALKRDGCATIRSEKRSGTSTANREELRTVLDFLRKGDVLMVTRIDWLARASATCRISFEPCGPRRLVEGDRAADRHQHGGGQVLPRRVGVFAEFEDEPTPGAAA